MRLDFTFKKNRDDDLQNADFGAVLILMKDERNFLD